MDDVPLEIIGIILSNIEDFNTLSKTSLVNKRMYHEARRFLKPKITYYPNSDRILSEEWRDKKGNKRMIVYFESGEKKETWENKQGKYHRLDGPAYQFWFKDGKRAIEEWYVNGKRHREGGPAGTAWHENGKKRYEEWFYQDQLHRLDSPAVEEWDINEKLTNKEWHEYGNREA